MCIRDSPMFCTEREELSLSLSKSCGLMSSWAFVLWAFVLHSVTWNSSIFDKLWLTTHHSLSTECSEECGRRRNGNISDYHCMLVGCYIIDERQSLRLAVKLAHRFHINRWGLGSVSYGSASLLLSDTIRRRRLSFFGHLCRADTGDQSTVWVKKK